MFAQLWLVFILIARLHATAVVDDEEELSSANKNGTWSLSEAITKVDRYITEYTLNQSLPSLSFGVAQRGKLIWAKAYGYADLENSVPAKSTTRYRLESITKSFTASLIGTLVDGGLMSFDDLLSDHLSDINFPAKYWNNEPVNITISQLLSHTAGTYTDEDDAEYFRDVILAHNLTECIRKRKNAPLNFKPGTDWAYSNYGFKLLGAVIESVTNMSYAQAMSAFLVQQGLHSTVVETLASIVPDRARTYRSNESRGKALIPTTLSDDLALAEAEWSDGSLMSNVGDMLKYAQLWIDSFKGRSKTDQAKFLSPKTLRQMWTPHTIGLKGMEDEVNSAQRGPFQYGYAWFISSANATNDTTHSTATNQYPNSVWHSGGAYGVTNLLTIYPEEEIVVVVLCSKGDVYGLGMVTEFVVDNLINLK